MRDEMRHDEDVDRRCRAASHHHVSSHQLTTHLAVAASLPYMHLDDICVFTEVGDHCQAVGQDMRWSLPALVAIQEAAEAVIAWLFEMSQPGAVHYSRVTTTEVPHPPYLHCKMYADTA